MEGYLEQLISSKHSKLSFPNRLTVDGHLNWKEKIQQISKKISRGIGVLCMIRHFVDTKTLVQLYHAIILPFLSSLMTITLNHFK